MFRLKAITAAGRKFCFVVPLLGALAATGAQAHAIWLERDGDAGAARLYFGEFADNLREKTGATLDKIASPAAWQDDSRRPLAQTRRPDHIELAASRAGDVVATETGFAPREDKQRGGYTKVMFYAKAGRAETQQRLNLDLVPLAPNASQFTLMLRGVPVPKAQLMLINPSGWEKPLRTDEQGRVSLPATPWAGRYLLEAIHIDESAGEFAGQKYQRTRHVLTVSLVVDQGVAPPAR